MIEDLGVPVAITVKSTIKIVRSSIILQVRILLSFQKTDTNIYFFFSLARINYSHYSSSSININPSRPDKENNDFEKKKKRKKRLYCTTSNYTLMSQ